MSNTPAPIHRSRAARLIRAQIDGDTAKATQVFTDAINTSTLMELTSALAFITFGTLYLATKGDTDAMRTYVDDLNVKAQSECYAL